MAEPTAYLEKLSAFSRMLRLQGFAVSPEETADASRILIDLGFDDREAVKTALRTVYAKSREEQLRFDQVFDGFFISEEAMRRQAREQMEKEAEMEKARQEMQGRDIPLSDDQMDAYASLPEQERQKLQDFAEK